MDDFATDLNTPRPVVAGGTGGSTASAARTALGLGIGTNVQAHDAGLTSISGLTTAADQMVYTTALDTYAVADLTAAGRALLDGVDAAAQRATLELGTAATKATGTTSDTVPLIDADGSLKAFTEIKVWGVIDGSGVVSILGGRGLSSITDNGSGDYTFNFVENQPDTNYAALFTPSTSTQGIISANILNGSLLVGSVRVKCGYTNSGTGGFVDVNSSILSFLLVR